MAGVGQLRERITIRRKSETKNDGGGLTAGWTTICTVWAQIKSLNGREALLGHVLQGISTFEIAIRYRTDLKPSDQVLWGARELNIVAPPEDREGKKRFTIIQASSQAPQGA